VIPEAEVRRLAGQLGSDPMIVDLDYVLGCLLASLYQHDWAQALLFKGGTCLRKCYYRGYRFSEDLDFTAVARIRAADLEKWIAQLIQEAEHTWQVEFSLRPFRLETVHDEYGKETYQARIYYRGPLRRAGDPRAVRLDITLDEEVAFPPVPRSIIHPYSDAPTLSAVQVQCYGLMEVVAEKVRAVAGQRRYAIARDLWDLAYIVRRVPLVPGMLVEALPAKLAVKGLPLALDVQQLEGRRAEFELDWERNLAHLLPFPKEQAFEDVWDLTFHFVRQLAELLHRHGQ